MERLGHEPIVVRRHAVRRCQERLLPGATVGEAITFIKKMYAEAKIRGTGQGNTHVLEHPKGFLLVEYTEDHVTRIVTVMPPDFYDPSMLVHPDGDEADPWDDWVKRNSPSSGRM